MNKTYSVNNKEEAIYYNRMVYNGEFGTNYDKNHYLEPTHYAQKIFYNNVKEIINQLSNQKENLRLIDIGAGTGSLSLNYYKFIRHTDTVINLDISENMLELLKEKLTQQQVGQSQFVTDDAYSYLKKSDHSFDLVGFSGSLHHFYDYEEVIEMACQSLCYKGYLYIALEPKQQNNFIEKTIRNLESVFVRYKKGEFGIIRCIIKILYTPFHFLNRWLDIKENHTPEGSKDFYQQKSEVVTTGLDLVNVLKILKLNNLKVIKLFGGPDYVYYSTFKILNFFKINSHFQLIAQKET